MDAGWSSGSCFGERPAILRATPESGVFALQYLDKKHSEGLILDNMSRSASRAASGVDLTAVDLSAVRANLRALGHDVGEEQLVSMLKRLDISQILASASRPSTSGSRSARHLVASAASLHCPSTGTRLDEPAAQSAQQEQHQGEKFSRYRVNASEAGLESELTAYDAERRSSSRSDMCRSEADGSIHDKGFSGASSGSLSGHSYSRQLTSSGLSSQSVYTSSWYCDSDRGSGSLASQHARRRLSRCSWGSGSGSHLGDSASSIAGSSTGLRSTAAPAGQMYLLQGMPLRPPQTDRVAKWSEYKEIWNSDAFLRAGGDQRSSRRPRENFEKFFAREHALLALEREAYIRGRSSRGIWSYEDEDSRSCG